ncbi:hypothetical protein [Natrialba asiatica]|uniref:Uncharacterized protein n=1 Tax=Natrialba asiatica (strain ATCC 700177 / DSM 12278 / JCM 9576 / FERM P-10747 / NBRC 102637 / 172P1) TaxID=29540 RepID=M0B2U4_NATA1|nr:hypothetical protein [Natrialba asiatica]ELZ04882.1 hypothetical protein C481_03847 [Natrialba asiatica DSM 12278]
MDKETLPRWGWLLVGLFVAAMTANLFNLLVLGQAGFPDEYQVITVITAMAPVLIYVGVWYDEERQQYWEQSQAHIVGDVVFLFSGAAIGSAIAIVAVADFGLRQFLQDILAMVTGFMLAWGLFWWRNPTLYRSETDQ